MYVDDCIDDKYSVTEIIQHEPGSGYVIQFPEYGSSDYEYYVVEDGKRNHRQPLWTNYKIKTSRKFKDRPLHYRSLIRTF